ncbi:MAG: hypothetical protein AABX30_01005 [Nanoarchaeota archaeon]
MFFVAKKILSEGVFLSIEEVSVGGIAGSQTITHGTIKQRGKYTLDYSIILEKAVQKEYKKQQDELPREYEQREMIRNHIANPDNQEYRRQVEDLRTKLYNLNSDFIRRKLSQKLEKYLGRNRLGSPS